VRLSAVVPVVSSPTIRDGCMRARESHLLDLLWSCNTSCFVVFGKGSQRVGMPPSRMVYTLVKTPKHFQYFQHVLGIFIEVGWHCDFSLTSTQVALRRCSTSCAFGMLYPVASRATDTCNVEVSLQVVERSHVSFEHLHPVHVFKCF
jgi:hypothetical protein